MLFVGSGDFDASHMTEARSHFALWAMMNAPLLIGFDLRKPMPSRSRCWATGDHRAQPRPAASGGARLSVRRCPDLREKLANGDKAVAILNRTASPVEPILTADHLKLRGSPVAMTDLWTGQEQLGETS
jgi:hypothetical protein